MQLPLQDFTALVRTQAAAAGAACRQLIDVSVGSVLLALLEANASVGLWIQWLIVQVLSTTRAATSQGEDLDTWVADFGVARLAGVPAYGMVQFSRTTAGLAATVPVGALVRTGLESDAQAFTVVADASHPAWAGSGYRLSSSDLSANIPVRAQVPGRAGNVKAGAVTLLSSAIAGVDAVTNLVPMVGGLDEEADGALRLRFGGYFDSRTRATAQAVGFAIRSLQQEMDFAIADRVDTAGAVRPGHFTVTVDDGSGAPGDALLGRVAAAIEQIRPLGGTFSIRRPLPIAAAVEMRVAGPQDAMPAVRSAIGAYVAGLRIGQPLVLSRLYQLAHDAHPGISRVFGVAVNGVASDLIPPGHGLVRLGQLAVLS